MASVFCLRSQLSTGRDLCPDVLFYALCAKPHFFPAVATDDKDKGYWKVLLARSYFLLKFKFI
jgi:hypothetical protein